jgi:hypothetical protein
MKVTIGTGNVETTCADVISYRGITMSEISFTRYKTFAERRGEYNAVCS